jgi:cytoskeletal protein RodZ
MDPIEKQERKRDAKQRLRAQRRRAGELRGRVVAISLIAFVLLWGVVFAQMATGNDPVLGDSSSTTTSHRGGSRSRSTPKAIPPEAEAGTDSEEATEPAFVEPEPVEAEVIEPEVIEPEVIEPEAIEPEPEPEPAPVITSQS